MDCGGRPLSALHALPAGLHCDFISIGSVMKQVINVLECLVISTIEPSGPVKWVLLD